MKKKIANGIQLLLLVGSFIILSTKCVTVMHYASTNPSSAIQATTLALASYYATIYPMYFFYAVCAVMCVVSILTKAEHRDGKMHSVVPILWFVFVHWNLFGLTGRIGDFVIVSNQFPAGVFEVCALGVVILGFLKRSTLIAGHPVIAEVKPSISQADELKKYKDLLDSGAITQEEFDTKKKQLLGL